MDEKTNVILLCKEENTSCILNAYLKEFEDINVINEFSDYDQSKECISQNPNSIVICDVSENEAAGFELIASIKNTSKSSQVIAITGKISVDVIVKALRVGAKEVLPKPVLKTDFINSVNTLKAVLKNSNIKSSCKIISTFSNKGGIGKTSVAVNLAAELAQLSKEKVALIDLNLQLGDVATFLDIVPMFTMDYIADNIQNLNETEILRCLTRYKNTSLYVLADPLNIDKSADITADQIEKIIQTLKKTFSYIVIDIGTNVDSKIITAMDLSDLILLVSIVNLPAIRSTQRCMELFNKLGYTNKKIKLVLNRYMENEEIKTSNIEEVVMQKVYWKIPNNYLTMMSAINKGVPVNEINQDSNIAKNYKDFASNLSDYLITQDLDA